MKDHEVSNLVESFGTLGIFERVVGIGRPPSLPVLCLLPFGGAMGKNSFTIEFW